jgi:hypothetical protein
VRIDDIHLGQIRNLENIEYNPPDRLSRGIEKVRDLIDENSELARLRGKEGIQGVGIIFRGVECGTCIFVLVSKIIVIFN